MKISNKAVKFKFALGVRVKDITCDFEGVITSRTQYLNGCLQYQVAPEVDKEGKMLDSWNIDEAQLVQIDKGIHEKVDAKPPKAPKRVTGGPSTCVSRR